jgi:hypothetical protein
MIQRGSMARGKTFLDKRYGKDWYNRIDLEKLDMSSGEHCLIGQLDGWYNNVFPIRVIGIDIMSDEMETGEYYGFMGNVWKDDERLTKNWKRKIRQLRREEKETDKKRLY